MESSDKRYPTGCTTGIYNVLNGQTAIIQQKTSSWTLLMMRSKSGNAAPPPTQKYEGSIPGSGGVQGRDPNTH